MFPPDQEFAGEGQLELPVCSDDGRDAEGFGEMLPPGQEIAGEGQLELGLDGQDTGTTEGSTNGFITWSTESLIR